MKNTNIKDYIEKKDTEMVELQRILFELRTTSRTSKVYQNTYYDARVLAGKMKKIENQMQGSLMIVENVRNGSWGVSHLSYIENLAKEEFGYHLSVDAQYYLTLTENMLAKILGDIEDNKENVDVALLTKRLTGMKEKFVRNVKGFVKLSHKDEWVRDRYFEIASFISFELENGKILPVIPLNDDTNSLYDIVTSGEKTLDQLKANNLYFDVAKFRSDAITNAIVKDLLFERDNMANTK